MSYFLISWFISGFTALFINIKYLNDEINELIILDCIKSLLIIYFGYISFIIVAVCYSVKTKLLYKKIWTREKFDKEEK